MAEHPALQRFMLLPLLHATDTPLCDICPMRWSAAEHYVQWVWRRRSRSHRQRDGVQAGDNIENALISQTPLQLMFGGCCLLYLYTWNFG